MILKNVVLNYAFINRTDDNDNYRIQFKPNETEQKKLEEAMSKLAEEKGVKDPDWWGSYKEEEGTYSAKCSASFTKKNGETVENKLRVYDKKALLMEDVPSIANGAIGNIEIEPYYCEYKKKSGIMLGLRSIQLLEYTEYSGGNPYQDESGENPFTGEDLL